MGQRILIGLIVLAGAIALVRYTACNKPTIVPPPQGDGRPARVSEPTTAPARTVDDMPRASNPAVAAAIDELLAAWDQVPSVYAAVATFMPSAAGNKGQTVGVGQYYLQKRDGKVLIDFELKNKLRIVQEDLTKLITGELLVWIIDGDYLYTFTNQPGFIQAAKKKLDYNAVLLIGGRPLFRDLIADNKLSLQSEEMLDGRAVRVILAEPNDGALKTRHYFDKATGIRLKMEETDADGKSTLRITLSDLDLASSISDERFKFTVPAGVTFVDETAQTP